MAYSDRHLRRKLDCYGLEKIPLSDVYRWPAEAPDKTPERCIAALDEAGLLATDANDTSEQHM